MKRTIFAFVPAFCAAFAIGLLAVDALRLAATAAVALPALLFPPPKQLTLTPETAPLPVNDNLDQITFARPESEFDPTGEYGFLAENVPLGFSEIDHVTVKTTEYVDSGNGYVSRPIVPRGTIHARNEHRFTKLAVSNREISFETETVGGISYRFIGRFPEQNPEGLCETCDFPADLEGRLVKLKNGKIIAEKEIELFVLGC